MESRAFLIEADDELPNFDWDNIKSGEVVWVKSIPQIVPFSTVGSFEWHQAYSARFGDSA